jgi:Zn-dependent M28 family amino/carboxypeptidase
MKKCIQAAVALLLLSVLTTAFAGDEEEIAGRIVGSALVESRAYAKLSYLTDRIGHRLSGSVGLEQAVAWTAEAMRADGIEKVWTEKVMVPQWVRGHESVRVVAPIERTMQLLALGGSVGTPEGGVEAEVFEVWDLDAVEAAGEALRGKIVLYNRPMRAGGGPDGYGSVAQLRARGASAAARYGAVAMLIRSLGTADYRLPHTGALRYADDVEKIPAAAIAVEDAALLSRLIQAGDPVRVHLELGSKTLADVESANVIGEIRGREKPDEIVLIGAHLDSWDVGDGAHDDGGGCAIVMESLRLIQKLGVKPRRTIRGVLFTNEENGLRGGKDYAARHGDETHVAAIETDSGAFRPLGFGVTAGEGGVEMVRGIARHLSILGADTITAGGGGADISPLRKLGVPVMGLRVDGERYFDYHHTAADTLDKVDRADLDRGVAAMALMAYMLADHPDTLPRLEPE